MTVLPRRGIDTFMPDPFEAAVSAAVENLESALTWLAIWCPHGADSSRVGDYIAADQAREKIMAAVAVLRSRSA